MCCAAVSRRLCAWQEWIAAIRDIWGVGKERGCRHLIHGKLATGLVINTRVVRSIAANTIGIHVVTEHNRYRIAISERHGSVHLLTADQIADESGLPLADRELTGIAGDETLWLVEPGGTAIAFWP